MLPFERSFELYRLALPPSIPAVVERPEESVPTLNLPVETRMIAWLHSPVPSTTSTIPGGITGTEAPASRRPTFAVELAKLEASLTELGDTLTSVHDEAYSAPKKKALRDAGVRLLRVEIEP